MCILALAFPGIFASTLSFDARPGPVARVLEQLSAATGRQLKSTTSLDRETLMVSVKNVTLDELKLRIADALDAKWVSDGSYDVLKREAEQDRKIWARHLQVRREEIERERQRRAKLLERPFDATGFAKKLKNERDDASAPRDINESMRRFNEEQTLRSDSPLGRLLSRLFLACSVDDLAAVGPLERGVFRRNPTALQGRIDQKQWEDAQQAFAKEQTAWSQAYQRTNFRPSSAMSEDDSRIKVGLKESKEWLVGFNLDRSWMSERPRLSVIQSSEMGPTEMTTSPFAYTIDPTLKTPQPPDDSPTVSMSPPAKLVREWITSGAGKRAPATHEVLEILTNPESYDPVDLAFGDVLFTYGKWKNSNIIAALPESCTNSFYWGYEKLSPTVSSRMNQLLDAHLLRRESINNWEVFTPNDRFESDFEYTPRPAMGKLLRSLQATGQIDGRIHLEYAFQSGRRLFFGLPETIINLINVNANRLMLRNEWDTRRFYGSFSPEEQKRLERGATLNYSLLSTAQKALVSRIAFEQPIVSRFANASEQDVERTRIIEPTDVFGEGIPTSTQIRIKSETVDSLVIFGKDGAGKWIPFDSPDLTYINWLEKDGKENAEALERRQLPKSVRYGIRSDVNIQLEFDFGAVILTKSIKIAGTYSSEPPVPWQQLPQPMVQRIKRELTRRDIVFSRPGSQQVVPPW